MSIFNFQNWPPFSNLALHWGFSGFWVMAAFVAGIPEWLILGGGFALAAAKEFWFDMRYEDPPQKAGSIAGGGALQDFTGYGIGILWAVWTWHAIPYVVRFARWLWSLL